MPPRDPTEIQADFPVLVADLIDQLQLVGRVGLLNFIPTITPTFIVGSRGLTVTSDPILYTPAQIFDGSIANWAANTTVFDTGQLPAGDYDCRLWMSVGTTAGGTGLSDLQHRDAANAATLTSWAIISVDGANNSLAAEFSVTVALNERFRVLAQVAETGRLAATLAIRARPTP